jgi:cell division protein FtsW
VDYHRIVDRSHLLIFLVWVGLIAVLIFGTRIYGAKRWLSLGLLTVQVSEFAKLAIILIVARHCMRAGPAMTTWRGGLIPGAIWLGITCALVGVEPDFGTALFIFALGLLLLNAGGIPFWKLVSAGAMLLTPFIILMMTAFSHIADRMATFLAGTTWQVERAKLAFGHGGLTGAGPGGGRAHLGFLPKIENDFVLAAIGEQYGYVGTMVIALLFLVILWHGLKISVRAPDKVGSIVAFGVTIMIVFQGYANMGVATGILPPKGISLPFISAGGSNLLMLGLALGCLINVARQGRRPSAAATNASIQLEYNNNPKES